MIHIVLRFSILLFALVFTGCMDGLETDPTVLYGRWRMERVIHEGQTFKRSEMPPHRFEVEIAFYPNGEVAGTYPSDIFYGSYQILGKGLIQLECRQLSKIGVLQWGWYLAYNVPQIKTYSIRKTGIHFRHNELRLMYDKGYLIFERI